MPYVPRIKIIGNCIHMKVAVAVLCAGVMILFSVYLIWTDGEDSYISVYLPILSLFGLIGVVTAPFLLRIKEGTPGKPSLEWCYVLGLVTLSLPIILSPVTLGFSILMMPITIIIGSVLFVPACALLVLQKMKK